MPLRICCELTEAAAIERSREVEGKDEVHGGTGVKREFYIGMKGGWQQSRVAWQTILKCLPIFKQASNSIAVCCHRMALSTQLPRQTVGRKDGATMEEKKKTASNRT